MSSTSYSDLVSRLRTRAGIRRSIRARNGIESDRIADDLEAAAEAIERLQEDYDDLFHDWRDEY